MPFNAAYSRVSLVVRPRLKQIVQCWQSTGPSVGSGWAHSFSTGSNLSNSGGQNGSKRPQVRKTTNGQFIYEFGEFSRSRSFHTSDVAFDGKTDPYGTLGLSKTASTAEIKKTYYSLAKKYHPDVNKEPGAEKKFHDIQAAYEILSDPQKKQQFDTFGASSFDPSAAGGANGDGGPFNPFSNFSGGFGGFNQSEPFDFEDLFDAAFGGGNGRRSGRRKDTVQEFRGDDIEVLLTLSFMDAAKGKSVEVKYNPLVVCNTCSGSGLKPGHKRSTCPRCRGSGTQVQMTQGGFTIATTCMTCNGSGVYIDPSSSCSSCAGEGVVKSSQTTTVDIPGGIDDGMRLRVVGEGDSPSVRADKNTRTHRGDLYVRVRVQPHPEFSRKGATLFYNCEIPMTTAALGGRVRIPTLEGQAELNVPSATQTGAVITMTGKGLPMLERTGRNGDYKITFKVKTLRPTTAEQTRLLELLADSFNDTTARKTQSPSPDK
ncbi:hypothetical protein V1511DRAFT_28277 [Dipodascopsis uninucleata]